jgi:methylglyoxal reductase
MDMMDVWAPLCKKYNCTIANLALAWVLAQGKNITLLSGATTTGEIKQNVQSAEIELYTDDIRLMRDIAEKIDS